MAYADVSDIEARWRALSTDEQARAAVLLDDASVQLARLVAVDDSDQQQLAALKMVSCNMVIRVMSAGTSATFGATNASMTGGPYTQSWTYEAPTGDMYLTKAERALLGVSSTVIGTIRPRYHHGECCHD